MESEALQGLHTERVIGLKIRLLQDTQAYHYLLALEHTRSYNNDRQSAKQNILLTLRKTEELLRDVEIIESGEVKK